MSVIKRQRLKKVTTNQHDHTSNEAHNTERKLKLTRELRSCLARCGWPSVAPVSSPAILNEQEVM